jgi:hypothetical protein
VELGAGKKDGFDLLAVVIFNADFSVKGAVVAPYAAVWEVVSHQQYHRISFPQARQLAGAEDITKAVQAASQR